jgi:Rod binding domain-containing protein
VNIQLTPPALIRTKPLEPAASAAPAAGAHGETFHQALAQASSAKPDKVANVAKQFEALMIGQVLKSARESSDGGWLDEGDDQTGQLAMELGEQSLSEAMASRGTLGIAKLVTDQIGRHDPSRLLK